MHGTTQRPLALDQWINRCWRRLRFGQFLKVAADWLAMYLLLLGTTVLAVKLGWPQHWPHVMWLSVGVVPITVLAGWLSRRNRFTRNESIAVLDQRLGAGGLLMTLVETPDSEWQHHLPQMERLWQASLPQIWPTRFLRQIAVPAGFLILVGFIPPREIAAAPSASPVTAGQQASQQLEELLEEIQAAELLQEDERKQLDAAIERLSDDTSKSPLTHEKWETVDALRSRLKSRVDETAARMGQLKEALGSMAAALNGKSFEGFSAEQRDRLEREFFETLQKMSKNGALPGASQDLKDKLQRLLKSGELPDDPTEREELMNDLKEFLDQEADKLDELREKCRQCQNGAKQPWQQGQEIQQGRADAELTWGDESQLEGTKFKESILPEGHADKLRQNVIGVTGTAPEVTGGETAPRTQARESTSATGSESWNRTVRPRHRPVLRKYFDEKK